jgi:hypothetical protein
MIKIILKNNTMIRILAIELLNTILLLVFLMIKYILKKLMVYLDNFYAPCSVCHELKEIEKLCPRQMPE